MAETRQSTIHHCSHWPDQLRRTGARPLRRTAARLPCQWRHLASTSLVVAPTGPPNHRHPTSSSSPRHSQMPNMDHETQVPPTTGSFSRIPDRLLTVITFLLHLTSHVSMIRKINVGCGLTGDNPPWQWSRPLEGPDLHARCGCSHKEPPKLTLHTKSEKNTTAPATGCPPIMSRSCSPA